MTPDEMRQIVDQMRQKYGSESFERMSDRLEEIYRLYDVSEAEQQLCSQVSNIISLTLTVSAPLQVKILRTVTAIHEMLLEEVGQKKNAK